MDKKVKYCLKDWSNYRCLSEPTSLAGWLFLWSCFQVCYGCKSDLSFNSHSFSCYIPYVPLSIGLTFPTLAKGHPDKGGFSGAKRGNQGLERWGINIYIWHSCNFFLYCDTWTRAIMALAMQRQRSFFSSSCSVDSRQVTKQCFHFSQRQSLLTSQIRCSSGVEFVTFSSRKDSLADTFWTVVRSRKNVHTHGIFCFSPHQFKFAKEGLLCRESKIFLIKSFVKRRLAVSYTSII